MSDYDWMRIGVIFAGVLIIGFVRWIWSELTAGTHPADVQRREAAAEYARQWVEQTMLGYMRDFPQMTDEQVAMATHDQLINGRVTDRTAYEWCTPQTAGRIRRTVVLEMLRHRG